MYGPLYILDRASIHIASAFGLYIGIFLLLCTWKRNKVWLANRLPSLLPNMLLLSACILLILVMLREPWDVARGQWLGKAYIDFASWVIGLVLGRLGAKKLILMSWQDVIGA